MSSSSLEMLLLRFWAVEDTNNWSATEDDYNFHELRRSFQALAPLLENKIRIRPDFHELIVRFVCKLQPEERDLVVDHIGRNVSLSHFLHVIQEAHNTGDDQTVRWICWALSHETIRDQATSFSISVAVDKTHPLQLAAIKLIERIRPTEAGSQLARRLVDIHQATMYWEAIKTIFYDQVEDRSIFPIEVLSIFLKQFESLSIPIQIKIVRNISSRDDDVSRYETRIAICGKALASLKHEELSFNALRGLENIGTPQVESQLCQIFEKMSLQRLFQPGLQEKIVELLGVIGARNVVPHLPSATVEWLQNLKDKEQIISIDYIDTAIERILSEQQEKERIEEEAAEREFDEITKKFTSPSQNIDQSEYSVASNYIMRDQIFISYSHKDKKYLDELTTMLSPLVQSEAIHLWTDTQIKPGQRWHEAIVEALLKAKIGVMLVSPSFLASSYINSVEMKAFYEAEKAGSVTIFWIAIADSMVKTTPLNDFQCANNPAKPLSAMTKANRTKEWRKIAEKLAAVFNNTP